MRVYYRIALVLLLVYLLEDNVSGVPVKEKGRYKWLVCKPNSNDPNCVKKEGPLMDIPGPSQRLPPSAAKDIDPVESSEETEESSGDMDPLANSPNVKRDAPTEVEEPILEEGSGEIDYSNYVVPERVTQKLSEADLREDNMIQ